MNDIEDRQEHDEPTDSEAEAEYMGMIWQGWDIYRQWKRDRSIARPYEEFRVELGPDDGG